MERISARPRKKINYALLAKGTGNAGEMKTVCRTSSSEDLSLSSFLNGAFNKKITKEQSPQLSKSLLDRRSRRAYFEGSDDVETADGSKRHSIISKNTTDKHSNGGASRGLPETLLAGRSPRKRMRSVILSRYNDDGDVHMKTNRKRNANGQQVHRSLVGCKKYAVGQRQMTCNFKSPDFKEFCLPREWFHRFNERHVGSHSSEGICHPALSQFVGIDEAKTTAVIEGGFSSHQNGGTRGQTPKQRATDKEEEISAKRAGRRQTRVPAALREYDLGRHPVLPQISRRVSSEQNVTVESIKPLTNISSEVIRRKAARVSPIEERSSIRDTLKSKVFEVKKSATERDLIVDKDSLLKRHSVAVTTKRARTAKETLNENMLSRRETEGRREHAHSGFYRALLQSTGTTDIQRLNAKK